MELSRQVGANAETYPGLEQYAIKKFANALTTIPRQLAENSGAKGLVAVNALLAAHEQGQNNDAFDIEAGNSTAIVDAEKAEILDLLTVKYWGLKYSVNAACTVLRVDQIIMAKRAGGPNGKQPAPMDACPEKTNLKEVISIPQSFKDEGIFHKFCFPICSACPLYPIS